MGVEIERKWLIDLDDVPFDLGSAQKQRIVQTYLSFDPQVRLRNVNDGETYVMTVKLGRGEASQLMRGEFEAEITAASYEKLARESIGKVIEKTRYTVPEPGNTGRFFEIDVFEGEFAGLCVVEMEFASEEDAKVYGDPDWVLRDITYDATYKNIVMAQS